MREIHVDNIISTLRQLCIEANIQIRPDTLEAFHRALGQEDSEIGREVLNQLLIKGAGCDNLSALRMFTPSEGLEAAKDFIVATADRAGPNASPPFVIGVGMGGPFAREPCWPKRPCCGPWESPIRINRWLP